MRLEDMGEDGITEFLAQKYKRADPRVIKAIGDDTAVIKEGAGMALLLTTDTLTEGTHFRKDLTTPFLLGSKALAVSISDIAAMGARPLFYLVSLNMPVGTEGTFLKGLYRGIDKQARRFGLTLTGGNLSRSKSISITTTLMGEAPADEVVYREGARAGDEIFVTGHTGDSALGLQMLKKYGPGAIKKGPLRRQVRKHLEPLPRVDLGRELASRKIATAMIDTSDGLLLDLCRLCKSSHVGAAVEADRLPLSKALERSGKKAVEMALTGGEDYELLFTARPEKATEVLTLGRDPGILITRIGRVLPAKRGVFALDRAGRKINIRAGATGFRHF